MYFYDKTHREIINPNIKQYFFSEIRYNGFKLNNNTNISYQIKIDDLKATNIIYIYIYIKYFFRIKPAVNKK